MPLLAFLFSFTLLAFGLPVYSQFNNVPAGRILCDRGQPKFYVNDEGDFVRMQDWQGFCAQSRFGGNSVSLEGYCGLWHTPPRIMYDPGSSVRVRHPPPITVDYLCQIKCHCEPQPSVPQNEWPTLQNVHSTEIMSADGRGSNTGLPDSRDAYHSIIDTAYIGDWFHNPETQLSQTSGVSERVPATLVLYADQAGPFHARYFSGIEKRWVSLHSRNRIRCSGSLPPWPLPRPLRAVLYSSPPRQAFSVEPLQLLCATALSGGHPSANAGGLCLNHHPGLGPIVGFSDTWGVSDALSEAQLMDSMAIRIWCAKHCSCNGRDSSELPEKINGVVVPGKIWEGDADVEFGSSSIKVSPNGQNSFKFWPAGYGGQKRGGIQRGIGGGTATNDDIGDGKEVFAGQFDKALNAISTSSRGTIRGNVKPQCGGRCRGPTDCSSGGEEGTECVCSVDPATIRQKGLDPVFPVAACLAFSVVMNGRKGLKLWGRGEESWPCVCNASYVSSGCCGSVDGLVWDDHGGKIGSLLI